MYRTAIGGDRNGNLGASLIAMTRERLFSEDQARYVLTCKASDTVRLLSMATAEGILITKVGSVTADPTVKVASGPSLPITELRSAHEGWFPAYMAGEI